MVFVTVQGEYQIVATDGETRQFPLGRMLLIEDTTGTGHSTKVIGGQDVVVFAVGLPGT
jgi:hypothetical protein